MTCVFELAQGQPTRKYVDFIMSRVRMFKHFGVTPYFVFDGDHLPSKAGTESKRSASRQASRAAGLALLKAGKQPQAFKELQKSIDVTPEMARHVIEDLKKAGVPYVVAPYEADAQLVYLERQGIINAIVSEDSDLLVFGAKRLITKMDNHGECVEIQRKEFCAVREVSFTGWSDMEFRHMAIFSGCDYLPGIRNVGLKTAHRMIRQHKTPERILKRLQLNCKDVPEGYLASFKQAEQTFLYQRVFCPKKQEITFLTDPDPTVDIEAMPFIGAHVETSLARAIAAGDVHPVTKKSIVVPVSPSKRRISQLSAPVQIARQTPQKTPRKPITEYFGSRRIPLGEMDPNCFAPTGHQVNAVDADADAAAVIEEPRPIVFPLPRPYLDETESGSTTRSYTNRAHRRRTVPLAEQLNSLAGSASQNRRHTAGPAFQIYRDGQESSTSARPPKKARLCEDLPGEERIKQTPERSKFFSAKSKRASKPLDDLLMSDDSTAELFRELPEFNNQLPEKRGGTSSDEAIEVDDSPSLSQASLPALSDDTAADESVEVPASSPLAPPSQQMATSKAPSTTPLRTGLQQFSYNSTRQTRTMFGLPTPSSSEGTSDQRSTPSSSGAAARLTPLQRIGAQALQRGRVRGTPPSSRKGSISVGSHAINPASVPLPKVDSAELETLNGFGGSEDLIIPQSEEEDEGEDTVGSGAMSTKPQLDLSRFLYR